MSKEEKQKLFQESIAFEAKGDTLNWDDLSDVAKSVAHSAVLVALLISDDQFVEIAARGLSLTAQAAFEAARS